MHGCTHRSLLQHQPERVLHLVEGLQGASQVESGPERVLVAICGVGRRQWPLISCQHCCHGAPLKCGVHTAPPFSQLFPGHCQATAPINKAPPQSLGRRNSATCTRSSPPS